MAKRPIPKVANASDYVQETNPNLMYNVDGPFNIMGGDFMLGSRGEAIINGGYGGMVAVVGEANVGKTTLLAFLALITNVRYGSFTFQFDSEGTGQVNRVVKLGEYIQDFDPDYLLNPDSQQFFRTDSKIDGPTWHTGVVDWAKESSGYNKKKYNYLETPFTNRRNEVIYDLRRHQAMIDSITYFKTSKQVDTAEDVEAGDAKKNTYYMQMAATQQDIIVQGNLATARYGMNYLLAAHTKPSIRMGKYDASPSQLKGLKPDHRIKGGGNAIVDLPTSIWYIRDKSVYHNSSSDKTPRYPSKESLQAILDPDLVKQTVQNLRGKSGLTDLQFTVVASQAKGLLIGLTNLVFAHDHDKYGLIEHTANRIFSLDILPETKWQRTTIRALSLTDPVLKKALQYNMELTYIAHHMDHHAKLLMHPKDLYKTLVDMGYDWNVLLDPSVRDWWCYRDDEPYVGEKFLSSFDLLRMARGLYVPYWFTKEQTEAIDLSKAVPMEG